MSRQPDIERYLKVRKEGGARVLALSPFIPKEWKLVRVVELPRLEPDDKSYVIIQIQKVA